MCGILAILDKQRVEPSLEHGPDWRSAMERLSHRGPDASGVWRSPDGHALLGHTRLAIQDLSDTGATERSLEAYYRTMLSEKLELGSFMAYRQNPNHFAEDGDEFLFMATLRYRQ